MFLRCETNASRENSFNIYSARTMLLSSITRCGNLTVSCQFVKIEFSFNSRVIDIERMYG